MLLLLTAIVVGTSITMATIGPPPVRPWSGSWRVGIVGCLALAAEIPLVILAGFVGHTYFGAYLFVLVAWLLAFAPLCSAATIGRAGRRLAIGIVIFGTGYWLIGLSSALHNPGWQF